MKSVLSKETLLKERFVGEQVEPVVASADTVGMAKGEPGLPHRFLWRGKEYSVEEVLEQWKETSPCTHGSGERYVRKHWYRLRTTPAAEMTVYFLRRPRRGGSPASRWWLYMLSESTPAE